MSSKGQPIIGVDVQILKAYLISSPFSEGTEATLKKLLKVASFRVRNDALEADESWRHFISYQLVFDQRGRIFIYQRGENIGEKRLSGLFSVGVGGHIERKDFFEFNNGDPSYEGLVAGADRELCEELHFQNLISRSFAGFICSSDPPVDRVHLGLVYKIEIDGFEGVGEELAERGGRFVALPEVLKKKKSLESWSQILLLHLQSIKPVLL
ncbi:hypothetical protein A2661_00695 [Candidatus Giovannonibacteria bacterium RIFCSPHIGHO2_01_FULL_45_24]|uniref:Nudix hydrolase domain-containing protein n=1 Tax=Candidatus Giovannonibacteria bacterium RIFCSPLOWO2_01_FULL_46_32 TaxID=1798353 RepID=A0A1F5XGN6_9BACT|nr:MAG: hypothetical protein A2661_00695 [Candidatus Giovannonibacteria bacterium RIFCSPHIGHO2_01_FULL_45_24]OGF87094.1 MAG: hypothetical protein A3B19_01535 [Candidatus Giovannonibacteria bacterium RIFCSPLOWO2_01_FULL_46_32]